jgi:uncharacterized phage-associated protein
MYSPKSIANYFLDLARASGESITPMKLQKLVYYAHGWYAGQMGKPLINEAVEAWQYGPVIPSLYHEFKQFGASVITRKACEFDGSKFQEVSLPEDPSIRKFLENIWGSYGRYTGITLSEMTHATGSPWDTTWNECQGMHGADISFDRIQQHFRAVVEKAKQKVSQP